MATKIATRIGHRLMHTSSKLRLAIWLCLMLLGNKILGKGQTGLLRSHAVSFAVGLACVLILAMMMVV